MGRTRAIARRMLTMLAMAAGVWCGCTLLIACVMADRIMYPAHLANVGTPDGPPREGIERVWMPIEGSRGGERVEGWFILGQGRSAASPGAAVMFFHGNAALIDYSLDYADLYLSHGVSVLLPEYRGYGRSGGSPSQAGITADMIRFRDWLDERPEVDRARIVYHGQSLGGGIAGALADERPPAAIILQSTFTSAAAMAWRFGVPPFLVRDSYRSDRVVAGLGVPVLIVHGSEDGIIPVEHGRRLHRATPGSRYEELPCGHNDLPRDWGAFGGLIGGFLAEKGIAG